MAAQTTCAPKEQHLAPFAGMGIGERKLQPALRDRSLKPGTGLLRRKAPLALFAVILCTNGLDLQFA